VPEQDDVDDNDDVDNDDLEALVLQKNTKLKRRKG
jgi:hypothetical protein